jgi:hypothetical protein
VDQHELDELAQKLAETILRGLGTQSKWALRTALDAAGTEGIPGHLSVRIPPRVKDYLDIRFTVGQVDIITRWDGAAS